MLRHALPPPPLIATPFDDSRGAGLRVPSTSAEVTAQSIGTVTGAETFPKVVRLRPDSRSEEQRLGGYEPSGYMSYVSDASFVCLHIASVSNVSFCRQLTQSSCLWHRK